MNEMQDLSLVRLEQQEGSNQTQDLRVDCKEIAESVDNVLHRTDGRDDIQCRH